MVAADRCAPTLPGRSTRALDVRTERAAFPASLVEAHGRSEVTVRPFRLNRRTCISGAGALILSEAPTPLLAAPSARMRVVDLRCEWVDSPLGVETRRP